MFDSIQTAMAYAGGEADAVRKCDPRLFDSDTRQGNRHDVSWTKMQSSLYFIENEAAIASVCQARYSRIFERPSRSGWRQGVTVCWCAWSSQWSAWSMEARPLGGRGRITQIKHNFYGIK